MKFVIWIVLGIVILLLIRWLSPSKGGRAGGGGAAGRGGQAAGGAADRASGTDDRGDGRELMLRCNVCGVHIPSSDAVFARGRVYCGAEHRDADVGRDRTPADPT